jgi:hypothetical protein
MFSQKTLSFLVYGYFDHHFAKSLINLNKKIVAALQMSLANYYCLDTQLERERIEQERKKQRKGERMRVKESERDRTKDRRKSMREIEKEREKERERERERLKEKEKR